MTAHETGGSGLVIQLVLASGTVLATVGCGKVDTKRKTFQSAEQG